MEGGGVGLLSDTTFLLLSSYPLLYEICHWYGTQSENLRAHPGPGIKTLGPSPRVILSWCVTSGKGVGFSALGFPMWEMAWLS